MKVKKAQMSTRLRESMLFSAMEPKSICVCGHTGDGAQSQHAGFGGQGGCVFDGGACCDKFTWKRWTREYQQFMVDNGFSV
jgi:hypothetical protein